MVTPQGSENSAGAAAAWHAAMAAGDFERAWAVSDAVLAARPSGGWDDPTLPYHLRAVWDGRPFDGADVLVRCYHGLGDTLQFCRFLPALRRRARRVTLECQPALLDLLAGLPGPDRIVPFDTARPQPPAECDIEIMELAHALRLRPEPEPYLQAAPDGAGAVGLCWRGGGWRPERDVPAALLHDLLRTPGQRFCSLQRGATLPGLADDCPASMLGTARRIAGCRAVLTVDTMVAHLAGALGRPTLLLLDADPDWRWRAGGHGSPWYGGLRKLVQPSPGDWRGPLDDARAILPNLGHC